jgi:dihydrofolate reductase
LGRLVANCFLSQDGVMGEPERWHHPYYDQQLRAAVGSQFPEVDAVLLGRVLYQEWAAHFAPKPAEEFGAFAVFLHGPRTEVVRRQLTFPDGSRWRRAWR